MRKRARERGALFTRLQRHGSFGFALGLSTAASLARYLIDPALPDIPEVILGAVVYVGLLAAANAWQVNLGWTVQIYNAAEALPNLINPFWMLPLMGILNVKARDLAGYSILQLLFHAPVVLLLCCCLQPS